MAIKGRKSTKKPPVLSHEFIIQNHADIISCVLVAIVFGMIVPVTTPICSTFVVLQYSSEVAHRVINYAAGLKDICTVVYYTLVCIILHAVQQEYVLDKVSKKLRLSKIKNSMFNESGQLLVFYLLSIVWSGDLIIKEDLLLNIRTLWEDYPHLQMPFMLKFFYIIQISYWLHSFPELYFSKTKREEMPAKIKFALVNLFYVTGAYCLNFNRVGVLLLFLHYLSEGFYHFARLFSIVDKEEKNSRIANMVSDIIFALSRVSTIILSLVTFVIGLSRAEKAAEEEIKEGDYNSMPFRVGTFLTVCALQMYLLFFFVKDHITQFKEMKLPGTLLKQAPASESTTSDESEKVPPRRRKDRKGESELTEADQNLKRNIRKKKK